MTTLIPYYELAGLVGLSGAILLTGLVLRNPFAPRILQTDLAAQAASLILTAAVLVATVYAHQGFVHVGLNPTMAAAAVVGVMTVSLILFWKLFHVGERLSHADAGRSPFARARSAATVPADLAAGHSTPI